MVNFAVTKSCKKMKKVISILVLSISFMCGLFINGEVKATEKDEEKVSVEIHKVDSIKACFSRYGIIEDIEEPITEDVTFSGRTVSESTTVTGTNISVQNVSVINGAKLTLVGKVSIGSTFLVESGSSLEIRRQ